MIGRFRFILLVLLVFLHPLVLLLVFLHDLVIIPILFVVLHHPIVLVFLHYLVVLVLDLLHHLDLVVRGDNNFKISYLVLRLEFDNIGISKPFL